MLNLVLDLSLVFSPWERVRTDIQLDINNVVYPISLRGCNLLPRHVPIEVYAIIIMGSDNEIFFPQAIGKGNAGFILRRDQITRVLSHYARCGSSDTPSRVCPDGFLELLMRKPGLFVSDPIVVDDPAIRGTARAWMYAWQLRMGLVC